MPSFAIPRADLELHHLCSLQMSVRSTVGQLWRQLECVIHYKDHIQGGSYFWWLLAGVGDVECSVDTVCNVQGHSIQNIHPV